HETPAHAGAPHRPPHRAPPPGRGGGTRRGSNGMRSHAVDANQQVGGTGEQGRKDSGSEGVKLAGIGRVLLVVAAVFVAVWLCVILYWRSSGATPGGTQMLLLLGVLPVALLGGIWLVRRARASRAEPAPAEEPKEVAAASGDEATYEATPPLHCLAGALRLPCGDDASEVLAVLPTPPRPGLHPKFRDRDGLPVFAAHVERLDTEGFADTLA